MTTTKQYRFSPPRSVYEYGFDQDGPIPQVGTATGFLLGWDALDAHTEAFGSGKPCQYLVVGEEVREDGRRFPTLAINPAYMESLGYEARMGSKDREKFIVGWDRPKFEVGGNP